MLKEKITTHLEKYGVPQSVFARRVGLSAGALYRYLHDDLKLSYETENRILEYLTSLEN